MRTPQTFKDSFSTNSHYPQHNQLFATDQSFAQRTTGRLESLHPTPSGTCWQGHYFSITYFLQMMNLQLTCHIMVLYAQPPAKIEDMLVFGLLTLKGVRVFLIQPVPVQLNFMSQRQTWSSNRAF